jgi:curved DNA-binding protein CbpA
MGPLDLDTAYSLLGFAHDQLPTESEISSSFRARIRNHHPDKGETGQLTSKPSRQQQVCPSGTSQPLRASVDPRFRSAFFSQASGKRASKWRRC